MSASLTEPSFTARIDTRTAWPVQDGTAWPVQRIVLTVESSGFRFRSGQYVQVLHPDGPIPLSIASAPRRLPELHLHYRSTPGVAEAARLDGLLAAGGALELSAPAGDVVLPAPLPGPTLIVAGGTGAAQAMSFIDDFLGTDPGAAVTLLWCVDQPADAYLEHDLTALEAPWLDVVVVADADRSPANRGLAWLRTHGERFRAPVVLAGSPGFVYAACDALAAAGLPAAQLRSDVFAYAPRPG
jgi:CDP-4-dehydro-6-deoxyglucose reductase, E3